MVLTWTDRNDEDMALTSLLEGHERGGELVARSRIV